VSLTEGADVGARATVEAGVAADAAVEGVVPLLPHPANTKQRANTQKVETEEHTFSCFIISSNLNPL